MNELEALKSLSGAGWPVLVAAGIALGLKWLGGPLSTAITAAITAGFEAIGKEISGLKDALVATETRHREDRANDQSLRLKTAEAVQANVLQLRELGGDVREMREDMTQLGQRVDAIGSKVDALGATVQTAIRQA